VTGGWRSGRTFLLGLDGVNCVGQAANNVIKRGQPLGNHVGGKQMIAACVTSVTFPRFTARDFQMLGKFSSEATAKALFNVGANGIKVAGLLLHQKSSNNLRAI
jgi:hypothetical protein